MIQEGNLRAFFHETFALTCLLTASAAMAACGGSEAELVGRERQRLTTRIFTSEPKVLEETLFDDLPAGVFAAASAGDSHLIITQSATPQVDGNGPRAFVVRDGTVVNSRGVDLTRTTRAISTGAHRNAINAGAHWFYTYENELSVLNMDGSLKGKTTLPSEARSMAWGANRALVMVGTGQGQFFDAQGSPLGDPFDIAPTETARNGGMAFDGSNFLVEYSTQDGVFAVAVSPNGAVGSHVELAPGYAQAFSDYGLGHSALSDGRTFLVVYASLADPRGVCYRAAAVDSSLAITLGPVQLAQNFALGNTQSAFLGDRYILTDEYRNTILHIKPDGTLRQPPSRWLPWADALGPQILSAPDGTSAIVVEFSGRASRITSELALVGSRLQVGLGPQYQGSVATAFDGSDFLVTWVDQGRSSARQAKVGVDGELLAPGPTQTRTATGPSRPDPLISNGTSVLRVVPANLSAVLTKADGSTVAVDLSALAGTLGYPGLATNGEDYLVVDSVGSSGRAVLVSPEGVVTRTLAFNGGAGPTATFDGENYLVGFGSYSGPPPPQPGGMGVLEVTPVSTDLVPGTPKVITTFPNASSARHTLIWNGTQALSVWLVHSETEGGLSKYEVRCSRVSRELELLDDPPVVLGHSSSNNQPAVTWDGALYWVAWADSDASRPWPESDTYLPAIRLVSPEPVNGSILLETDPLTLPGDPVGKVELAARPGGPVLLASTPYAYGSVMTRLLRARALKDGTIVVDELARQAALQDVSTTPTFLGRE
jgi:hypothetical protein